MCCHILLLSDSLVILSFCLCLLNFCNQNHLNQVNQFYFQFNMCILLWFFKDLIEYSVLWLANRSFVLYDKVDKQTFIEKLEIFDWITLLCQFDDVDDMCNQFTKTFLELARECIPTKTVIVRYNDKPWFTSEIGKKYVSGTDFVK